MDVCFPIGNYSPWPARKKAIGKEKFRQGRLFQSDRYSRWCKSITWKVRLKVYKVMYIYVGGGSCVISYCVWKLNPVVITNICYMILFPILTRFLISDNWIIWILYQLNYRNRFVTQYITYLNIWEALSGTLSSLSTHDNINCQQTFLNFVRTHLLFSNL